MKPRNFVVKNSICRTYGSGKHQKSKKAIRRNAKVALQKDCF